MNFRIIYLTKNAIFITKCLNQKLFKNLKISRDIKRKRQMTFKTQAHKIVDKSITVKYKIEAKPRV